MLKQYRDRCLYDNKWIIRKIQNENLNQIVKWGVQTHSSFEWLTYTTEEIGELSNAISEYEYRNGSCKNVIKEAIQLATLALKIAEMFNGDSGCHIEES